VTESITLEVTPERLATEKQDAVALLAAVADPVRWTVLRQLGAGQACVCDLQAGVDLAPNLLSYHLKVLRDAGLVTTSRRGRWIDYALAADASER
jgi:ArsR family transcriptional regulator